MVSCFIAALLEPPEVKSNNVGKKFEQNFLKIEKHSYTFIKVISNFARDFTKESSNGF